MDNCNNNAILFTKNYSMLRYVEEVKYPIKRYFSQVSFSDRYLLLIHPLKGSRHVLILRM